jgi:hypothetical protein
MAQPTGRWIPLSLPRRFISDLVYFSKLAPLTTIQRTVQLSAVVTARQRVQPRPGWCSLLTKAYSFAAAQRPPLRQAYMPWPWPHLYEHPLSVASVAVERRYGEEDAVFFMHLRNPHEQTLTAIEAHLARCKTDPVENIASFRRILQTSRLPLPVRRLLWRFGLYTTGRRRAKHFGTFGVSATAAFGAANLDLLTPLTTGLNYGVLCADGSLDVRLTYDHRVLDGGTAARALADMEAAMNGPILAELNGLHARALTKFKPPETMAS